MNESLKLRRILQAIADFCQTDVGADRSTALGAARNVDEAEQRLDRVDAAISLLRGGQPIYLCPRLNILQLLDHAARQSVLEGLELALLASVARSASRMAQAWRQWPREALVLRSDLAVLPDLSLLSAVLTDSISDDGSVLDSASRELANLRHEVVQISARLRKRVADLVKETDQAGILQDEYYTIRDDRYVLPVKVSDKRVLGGIIHGTSQTGQTVYVEPQEIVQANNQLALAVEAVRREERRILAELSQLCADHREHFTQTVEILAELDIVLAKARLSEKLLANRPSFNRSGRLDLRKARHPLLALDGAKVVANDIGILPPARWLVISGPNGGGKTVVLTTLGLTLEMARIGLPICAAIGSELPWIDNLFVVLGDEQDIDRGLSTFEGHLRAVQLALAIAAQKGQQALLLLDELANGTEPIAASALATAILESLSRKTQTLGAVTTHFEALKLLALRDDTFANAALGLDGRSLTPTYRLLMGEVGSSSPFALAERIGLDSDIIERASTLAGGGGSEVAILLDKLEQERRLLHAQMNEVETQQLQVDRLRVLLEDQRANELRAAERRIDKAAADAMDQLAQIKTDLEQAQRAIRSQDKAELEQASQVVTARQVQIQRLQRGQKGATAMIVREPLAIQQLKLGMYLWHVKLQRVVSIVEMDTRGQRLRIKAGAMEMHCSLADLRLPLPTDPGQHAPAAKPSRPSTVVAEKSGEFQLSAEALQVQDGETFAMRLPEWTCDLRGLRVEAALTEVDRLLDKATMSNALGICVVHGMGTGAVREAVRMHLRKHPQVQRFRRGVQGEGGDGATMVWVKQE